MTVSLGLDGDGLGTAWGHELATAMLSDAGFTHVEIREVKMTRSTTTTCAASEAPAELSPCMPHNPRSLADQRRTDVPVVGTTADLSDMSVHSSPCCPGSRCSVGCAVTDADPEKLAAGCSWFG
jgi:hypothetical protein